ncbi:MAG: hypothetical protein ISS70_15355 [Phycisphaerae bacterium]|nr:hypothetical protein [Phycisphaerae bacterium]
MRNCALRTRIVVAALTLCILAALTSTAGAQNEASSGLRILYAGLLDTDRAKDFVDFLDEHFEKVETTDYLTFTADKSAGFDVTILDHDGVDTRAPRPSISRQYSRATVTLGVPGADICSRLSLKTGYL